MDGGASVSETSSGRMCADALTPRMVWLQAAAARCQQMAAQARAAARAHESAFAMTVPPPLVEANRALVQTLATTNALGQSTPAIAAAEEAYGEMWAQDVAAMRRYAAASASATAAMPFTAPDPRTDRVAPSAGAETPVPQPATTIPDLLAKLASPGGAATMSSGTAAELERHLAARWGSFFASAISDGPSPAPATDAVDSAAHGAGNLTELDAVTAIVGLATSRGALSVPRSWAAS